MLYRHYAAFQSYSSYAAIRPVPVATNSPTLPWPQSKKYRLGIRQQHRPGFAGEQIRRPAETPS